MRLSARTTGRTPTNRRPISQIATFSPLAWQVRPWRDQRSILLLTGAAGGGKSRLAAEKLHGFCKRYPNSMALMLRKTRQSMTNSTVLFVERTVIGPDPQVTHVPSKNRFEYRNGSILAYGGMADEEQREQVRSIGAQGGVDIAWMEEATRFTEQDYNELLARMRGNAGGWRQIVLTTNPDAQTHWIKRRLIDGMEASVYYSQATDNPNNPETYIDTLRSMTGIQRERLLEGKWVQAEGVIYDNWSHENISPEADYNPAFGGVYWGMDDGYVYGGGPGTPSYHPRVVLLAQITPQGGINVFAEYYKALELAETTIETVRALGYPDPEVVYADSSAAEMRARLSSCGLMNVGATHPVSEGIKTLRRMICDGNGQRMFRVHPRCANLIRELQTYRYADSLAGVVAGEPKPEKTEDHGCLIAGTLIDTERGPVAIEDVRAGDRVLTRSGYQHVIAAGMTSSSAQVYEVLFSDGRTLVGTGNHPVFTQERGYSSIDALRYGDTIRTSVLGSEVLPWPKQIRQFAKRKWSSTGSSSVGIQTPNGWKIGATSSLVACMSSAAWVHCTERFGKRITGLFQTVGTFTIKMATLATTGSKTSNVCLVPSTFPFMPDCLIGESGQGHKSKPFARWLSNGTKAMRGVNGTGSTRATYGRTCRPSATPANNAALSSKHWHNTTVPVSARTTANRRGGARLGWMMRIASVRSAGQHSAPTATVEHALVVAGVQQNCAGVNVVNVTPLDKPQPVFNLTVNAVPEYFANGVLVHNCDSARYLAYSLRHLGA